MLGIARQRPGAAAIRFLEQDLTRPLPFPDAALDRALLCLVIEHLENPERLLREVRRVLRPGGFLVCSGMHPAMHLKGVQARFIDPGTGERVHVAGFRHQVLDYVGAAVRAGFHVDHISSTDQMRSWRGACPGPRDTSGTRWCWSCASVA